MPQTTLFVCSLCRFSQAEASRAGLSGGETLIQALQTELQARHLQAAVQVEPLRCMAGCSQPCNLSLAAPGKLTFILSQVAPTGTAAVLVEFCQQYTDSADGRVPLPRTASPSSSYYRFCPTTASCGDRPSLIDPVFTAYPSFPYSHA